MNVRMLNQSLWYLSVLIALLLVTTFSGRVAAQRDVNASPYTLRQSVVAAGGRTTGGPYTVTAVVGQPAAGSQSGGVYTLGSGLLGGPTAPGVPTAVQLDSVAVGTAATGRLLALLLLVGGGYVLVRAARRRKQPARR